MISVSSYPKIKSPSQNLGQFTVTPKMVTLNLMEMELLMADLQWNKKFAEEQTGGDPDLLVELMELLSSSSLADFEKIKVALAKQDGDGVADAAHSIKGASASLGVDGLRDIAYTFEKKGRAGDLADLNLSELEDMVRQLASLS